LANTKLPLPKLQDLHYDAELAFKNDELKLLLNQPPPEKWLKAHPMAKMKNADGKFVAARYLPIDKVEFLLDRIFQEWRCEVLRESLMVNSIVVTVRIHYRNPVTGEWSYHDGIGAKSLQVDSGSLPSDLTSVKDAALMMAAPSAKSFAIKDAVEHLGILFGRNVNRLGTLEFKPAYSDEKEEKTDSSKERLTLMINAAKTLEALEKLKQHLTTNEERQSYDTKYKQFKQL